jgi:hypothetical protein
LADSQSVGLSLEGVVSLEKPTESARGLAWHQLNPPRQSNHLKLLTRGKTELLAHPLGDHDLVFGGDSGEIHPPTVRRKPDGCSTDASTLVSRRR